MLLLRDGGVPAHSIEGTERASEGGEEGREGGREREGGEGGEEGREGGRDRIGGQEGGVMTAHVRDTPGKGRTGRAMRGPRQPSSMQT